MSILDEIVDKKRLEIQQRQQTVSESELERQLENAPPIRDFGGVLNVPGQVQVIAEVKKASPSAGIIRKDFDPVQIAQIYADNGAAAISVLTDAPFFQGELSYLRQIRQAVTPPLLRKDFLLERYQLLEARVAGADAVLLIAEILPGNQLAELLRETWALGMEALVELYDAENLPRVVEAGAQIIGINNRNLRTFVTKLEHTLELADQIPPDRCLVSESGIRTQEDIERLQQAGVKAVLIGETLMRSEDIGAKLWELRS